MKHKNHYFCIAVFSLATVAGFSAPAEKGAEPAPSAVAKPVPTIEDRLINLDLDGSLTLHELVPLLAAQLGERPNIIFKAGAEDLNLPPMQIEKVRFEDFVKTLEAVVDVKVSAAERSDPKMGSRGIYVLERTGKPPVIHKTVTETTTAVADPEAGRHQAGGHFGQPAMDNRPANGGRGTPAPEGFSGDSLFGDMGMEEGFGGEPEGYGLGGGAAREPVTRSFVIGKFVDENDGVGVIEAITTMWEANPVYKSLGDDERPRIVYHGPTKILIIHAGPDRLAEAEQLLSSLDEARGGEGGRDLEIKLARRDEEYLRERAHLSQLHEMTVENLRDQHVREIKALTEKCDRLEAELHAVRREFRKTE